MLRLQIILTAAQAIHVIRPEYSFLEKYPDKFFSELFGD